jgi:YggT family protein
MLTFLLTRLIELYGLLIVIYVLMSWIPQMSGWINDLYSVLAKICEPYLSIFRRAIPTAGALDFSPIVALLVLSALSALIRIIL